MSKIYSEISADEIDVDVREFTISDDDYYSETGTKVSPIVKFFESDHLSSELTPIARDFERFAKAIDAQLPSTAEKSAGLRKLLEAKDCAIRAALYLLD